MYFEMLYPMLVLMHMIAIRWRVTLCNSPVHETQELPGKSWHIPDMLRHPCQKTNRLLMLSRLFRLIGLIMLLPTNLTSNNVKSSMAAQVNCPSDDEDEADLNADVCSPILLVHV